MRRIFWKILRIARHLFRQGFHLSLTMVTHQLLCSDFILTYHSCGEFAKFVASCENRHFTIPHGWKNNTTATTINNDGFLKSILMNGALPNRTINLLKRFQGLSGYFTFVFVSLSDEF